MDDALYAFLQFQINLFLFVILVQDQGSGYAPIFSIQDIKSSHGIVLKIKS
jgi:hypothetical protein